MMMMIQTPAQERRESERAQSKRERKKESKKESKRKKRKVRKKKKRKRSHILGLQCSSSKGPSPSTGSYMPWQTGIIRPTTGHKNGFTVGPLAAEGIIPDGLFCIKLPASCRVDPSSGGLAVGPWVDPGEERSSPSSSRQYSPVSRRLTRLLLSLGLAWLFGVLPHWLLVSLRMKGCGISPSLILNGSWMACSASSWPVVRASSGIFSPTDAAMMLLLLLLLLSALDPSLERG